MHLERVMISRLQEGFTAVTFCPRQMGCCVSVGSCQQHVMSCYAQGCLLGMLLTSVFLTHNSSRLTSIHLRIFFSYTSMLLFSSGETPMRRLAIRWRSEGLLLHCHKLLPDSGSWNVVCQWAHASSMAWHAWPCKNAAWHAAAWST